MESIYKEKAKNNLASILTLMIFNESLSFFGFLATLVTPILESDVDFDFKWQPNRPQSSCLAYNPQINRFVIVIDEAYAATSEDGEDIIFSIVKELCHLMMLHPWQGTGLAQTPWFLAAELDVNYYIRTVIFKDLSYSQPDGLNEKLNSSYLTYFSLAQVAELIFADAHDSLWNNKSVKNNFQKLVLNWTEKDYKDALETLAIPWNPPESPGLYYSLFAKKRSHSYSLPHKYDLFKSILPPESEQKQEGEDGKTPGLKPTFAPSWSQITEAVTETAAINEVEQIIESAQNMSNNRSLYINDLLKNLKKREAKWSKIIPRWIGREFSMDKEENWGKMNNVLPDLLPGAVKTPRVKIGFIIDVSGSMDNNMVKEAAEELKAIGTKGFEVVYLQLANEPVENLKHEKLVANSFSKGFARKSTGGTDMNPGFEYFNFRYPVVYIVCCTDGEIPDIKPKFTKKKSLLLISSGRRKPKPYKNGVIYQLSKETSKS
jgi:hypothetical protein